MYPSTNIFRYTTISKRNGNNKCIGKNNQQSKGLNTHTPSLLVNDIQRKVRYTNKTHSPLKIILQNVMSLITRRTTITHKLISSYTRDDNIIFMSITETWLTKGIRDEADIEGYNMFRCDGTDNIKG